MTKKEFRSVLIAYKIIKPTDGRQVSFYNQQYVIRTKTGYYNLDIDEDIISFHNWDRNLIWKKSIKELKFEYELSKTIL